MKTSEVLDKVILELNVARMLKQPDTERKLARILAECGCVECEICHGSGGWDDDPCTNCGGHGWLGEDFE